MFDKLAAEEQRYEQLMARLGTAEVQSDATEYRKHAKALADVEPLVEKYREYKIVANDLRGAEELAASGAIRDDSVVFDTSLTDLGSLRSGFEKAARKSWAAKLIQ